MKIVFNLEGKEKDDFLKTIKDNNGYCPCSLLKNPDTKCMCKEFRDQSTPGPCHCGLYKKV